jgi:LuxR family maltose regulon positive regulatory protein
MSTPLLKTKLYIPPTRPELVPRPRLIEQLNAGLWQNDDFARKLTLVSAPAGFGKTTLITEWLQHLGAAPLQERTSGTHRSFAWLSLDDDDNNPAYFFTYLIAAIETVQADAGADARALLQSSQPPPLKAALTVLINSLAAMPTHVVLVLDDYQVVEQQSIHDALTFLLEYLPPQMHLVIASRADPPLPLSRLRTRGQLAELRAADLRFTPDEATAFLNQAMGLDLSPEDVAALEARTEGWIAGLQLAALSMRAKTAERVADFIAAFSGSYRHVIDYLAEEVLAQQSDEIHDFLCQTAILDQLTAPLCDAVTGRNDSDAVLRQLEQANLFLVPLDDQRKWYRYHRLFADFLRNHLHQAMPDQVRDLHCWAADWYEHNGLATEAVGHALEAADFQWAARLIEQVAQTSLMHGAVNTLLSWLKALPDALVRTRPRLGLFYAEALTIAGQLDTVEVLVQDIERNLRTGGSTTDSEDLLAEVSAIRAYLTIQRGDLPRAIELARQASEHLGTDSVFPRSVVTWLLALIHYFDQDTAAANRAFAETIELGQAAGNVLVTLLSIYTSGYLQAMQGHLRQAREIYCQGLQLPEPDSQHPGAGQSEQPFLAVSLIYQGLGDVLREQNDLENAGRYLTKCIELGEQWGNAEVLADSYIVLARAKQAQGDTRGANEVIGKAEQFVRENQVSPLTVRQIEAHRARLWVAQGNLEAAARWAASQERIYEAEDDDGGQIALFVRGAEQITLARLLIAQRRFEKATRLLEPLLAAEEAAEWSGLVIEILALQALALLGQNRTAEAFTTLNRALSLAEPEGYVRAFVDAGAPMAELLQQAVRRGMSPGYVSKLLAAFGIAGYGRMGTMPPHSPTPTLIEPLSERELEVLRLVAEGLSNREIAERLIVAVSTVKTHINHIYRKLGVSKRTQAVARARELDLW